jgi:hypothetical protein
MLADRSSIRIIGTVALAVVLLYSGGCDPRASAPPVQGWEIDNFIDTTLPSIKTTASDEESRASDIANGFRDALNAKFSGRQFSSDTTSDLWKFRERGAYEDGVTIVADAQRPDIREFGDYRITIDGLHANMDASQTPQSASLDPGAFINISGKIMAFSIEKIKYPDHAAAFPAGEIHITIHLQDAKFK